MNIQDLLADRDFWRDEAKRCYQEIKDYEAALDRLEEFLASTRKFMVMKHG